MNYHRTLIAVADDCPATASTAPVPRGGRKTVAVLQYEMLSGQPGRLTQEDVLFLSWLRRQPQAGEWAEAERAGVRARFFAKDQACLRASPLPKTYGFGLLCDEEGRVSLCPRESAEYRRLTEHPGEIRVLKALRSPRR